MILDTTSKLLKAVLSGAASPAPQFVCSYVDIDQNGKETYGQTEVAADGTTEVTLAAAPGEVTKRKILSVHCHNADNAQVTASIFVDDGSTNWLVAYLILETVETASFTLGSGWKAFTSAGELKVST